MTTIEERRLYDRKSVFPTDFQLKIIKMTATSQFMLDLNIYLRNWVESSNANARKI
jgi:hypothetical protein